MGVTLALKCDRAALVSQLGQIVVAREVYSNCQV